MLGIKIKSRGLFGMELDNQERRGRKIAGKGEKSLKSHARPGSVRQWHLLRHREKCPTFGRGEKF